LLRDGDEAVLNEADPNGDPDDEELDIGELDVNAGNVDSTLIKATVSVKQWDCWLLRGRREPLNSMGLYHYTMFVYQKKSTEGVSDFITHLYADLHPQCSRVVQRIRADECFRVPRLFGCGLPPPQGPHKELNAMMKTMLFRPMYLPEDADKFTDEMVDKDPPPVKFNGLCSFLRGHVFLENHCHYMISP